MRCVAARQENPPPMMVTRLNAVWYLEADQSYSVKRNRDYGCQGYTAVRTLTGEGRLKLFEGARFSLRANSVILLRSRDISDYSASEVGWQFYWFEFDADREPVGVGVLSEIGLSSQERIECERCLTALSGGSESEYALSQSLFRYMLSDWQLRSSETEIGGMSPQKMTALLEKGRREHMQVSEMAREAGMCERAFRDAAKEYTGLSPKAYMLKGEMTAAMELLRTTSMSVSDIAACFDYSSPFYFSRAFKKYYGVSPQHVRNGIRL